MSQHRKLLLIGSEGPQNLAVYVDALSPLAGPLELVVAASRQEAEAKAEGIEALIAMGNAVSRGVIERAPGLRWIQALTTGTDAIQALPLGAQVTLTSTRGVHGPQMTELAFLLMLALARRFPRMVANQQAHEWQRWPQPVLDGRTLLIVGVGSIGEMLAERAAIFGMRVEGVSDSRLEAPHFQAIHPRAKLTEAAATADFVIMLVPHEPETRHLADERLMRAMRPSAFLLNLARGPVVDEAALLRALQEGWIAGAGLDVFATEPLPANHPLWNAPNLIVTPHIGGLSDRYAESTLPIVTHNLAAYLRNDFAGMINVVRRGVM